VDRRAQRRGDIYAQRVNAAGVPQWSANGVALCTAVDVQSYPSIIADGAGGAIVGWRDLRIASFGEDVYAQRRIPFTGQDDHGRTLASGVYFYRVNASGATITKKLVITR
jgi:hypothetical protein